MGSLRDLLIQECAKGKKYNREGIFYWDPVFERITNNRQLREGISLKQIQAMSAGKAAAMGIVCPEVR